MEASLAEVDVQCDQWPQSCVWRARGVDGEPFVPFSLSHFGERCTSTVRAIQRAAHNR